MLNSQPLPLAPLPMLTLGVPRRPYIPATMVAEPASRWTQGAEAARDGQPVTACPYTPDTYHFVTWHNGWAATRHNMAREVQR